MAAKKEARKASAEATTGIEKGTDKDTKRKRIRKYELVSKWKNPVEILERGAI